MLEAESGVLYLEIGDVFALYAEMIGCTAQEAADQLRSWDGLEGALARPLSYAHYLEADLALQAAVLAHGIAEGQYFLDGNKRTALAAMDAFLRANSRRLVATRMDCADWILDLSRGGGVEELAERIRLHVQEAG